MHRPEPSGTRPAQQAQEERLSLIVARMAQCHGVGAEMDSGLLKKCMTRGAGRVFDRAPFPSRDFPYVRAVDHQGPVQRLGQFDAKRLVAVSVSSQLMVEMRQAEEATAALAVEFVKEMGQRDRVGSARNRRHHGCFRGQEVRAPNRFSNAAQ